MKYFVGFLLLLMTATSAYARIEINMEPVKISKILEEGYVVFDKGTWKIGDKLDKTNLRRLEQEKGPLRIFVVDGIGVLYLDDDTEAGGEAGCYRLQDLDRILLERAEKEKWRKAKEREAFYGEITS